MELLAWGEVVGVLADEVAVCLPPVGPGLGDLCVGDAGREVGLGDAPECFVFSDGVSGVAARGWYGGVDGPVQVVRRGGLSDWPVEVVVGLLYGATDAGAGVCGITCSGSPDDEPDAEHGGNGTAGNGWSEREAGVVP